MKIAANGLQIEVEDSGPGAAGEVRPAVLLIMGLGMQLGAWPPELVQALIDAGIDRIAAGVLIDPLAVRCAIDA